MRQRIALQAAEKALKDEADERRAKAEALEKAERERVQAEKDAAERAEREAAEEKIAAWRNERCHLPDDHSYYLNFFTWFTHKRELSATIIFATHFCCYQAQCRSVRVPETRGGALDR